MTKYLYAHWDNDELVYLGIGQNERGWSPCGREMNPKHQEWMRSQLPHLNVEIIAEGDVAMLESILISALRPKYNLKYSKPVIINGKQYHNYRHAAKLTGMKPGTARQERYYAH